MSASFNALPASVSCYLVWLFLKAKPKPWGFTPLIFNQVSTKEDCSSYPPSYL